MVDSIINKVCRQAVALHRVGVYLTLSQVVDAIKQELDVEVDEEYIEREVKSRLN